MWVLVCDTGRPTDPHCSCSDAAVC